MALAYPHPNIRPIERVLTAATGLGLLVLAARWPRARRPLASLSTAVLLRSLTGYCPGYAAVGVPTHSSYGHGTDSRHALAGDRGAHVEQTIRIARPPLFVYAFWRDLAQLSRALPPSIDAEQINATESHWTVRKAGVPMLRWTSRIINDEPARLIAWKTIGEAGVVSAGSVHFDAAANGTATDVRVHFQYAPPLGRAGAAAADMLGQGADAVVRDTLAAVKRVLDPSTSGPMA